MKFSDGYWHMRDNIKAFNATQVRDVRVDEKSLTVYSACKAIRHRGDTLNEPLLTIRYSSPMHDIICVRVEHFQGEESLLPEFELNAIEVPVCIKNNETYACLSSGNLSVSISKAGNIKTDFFYKNRHLTGTGLKTTGYILAGDQNAFIRE